MSAKKQKSVLIISPHFPPINAADMQRVRHSLPYFKEMGWIPEVIAVDPECIESYSTDELLTKSFPDDITIHWVKAYDVSKTRKFGLGSISMRSFFHYMKKGNELLKTGEFDLVYFTTTAFHVMALGRYWKQKFKVPYILDIQDPWRNDFYLDKPKNERPPKFVISYNIDKYLEKYTMKKVDGIISVSQGYVDMFLDRYRYLKPSQFQVIPFGLSTIDFDIMRGHVSQVTKVHFSDGKLHIVYVGRGGHDMKLSVECFFTALKQLVDEHTEYRDKCHCWFIGTSYALEGQGNKTIQPVAESLGLGNYVTEITDRITFFESLYLLQNADALFVPGSTDKSYTASKIYQYVFAEKPLLAIFYKTSSVIKVLQTAGIGTVVTFGDELSISDSMVKQCKAFLRSVLDNTADKVKYQQAFLDEYSAKTMTQRQVDFFNEIVECV